MNFDAAIARGFSAAESAWGVNWTPDGTEIIYSGTFDKLDDRSAPNDGGIRFEWDATLVCSIDQFGSVTVDDTTGSPLLDTTGAAILSAADPVEAYCAVGKKVIVQGRTYRIHGRQVDGYTLDLMLRSINR